MEAAEYAQSVSSSTAAQSGCVAVRRRMTAVCRDGCLRWLSVMAICGSGGTFSGLGNAKRASGGVVAMVLRVPAQERRVGIVAMTRFLLCGVGAVCGCFGHTPLPGRPRFRVWHCADGRICPHFAG